MFVHTCNLKPESRCAPHQSGLPRNSSSASSPSRCAPPFLGTTVCFLDTLASFLDTLACSSRSGVERAWHT